MTNGPDELLPGLDSPSRIARRRALVREKRAWIAGAIAAALVMVLLLVVAVSSDGDSSRAARPKTKAGTRTTSTSRPARTTTSTSGDETSTSSATTALGSRGTNGRTSGGTTAAGSANTAPSNATEPDVSQSITVSQNPGACSWRSDIADLVDTGTIANRASAEAQVDFEVTWTDSSGELDTWEDLETVPAHGSIPWEGSSGWTDPVQGATCQIDLLSATASGK